MARWDYLPLSDPAKVVDQLVLRHADAGVLDRERVGLLVSLDHNVDVLCGLGWSQGGVLFVLAAGDGTARR